MGRPEVPVYAGCSRPLIRPSVEAGGFLNPLLDRLACCGHTDTIGWRKQALSATRAGSVSDGSG